VFTFHDVFNPDRDEVEDLKTRYREGRVGDVEVKRKLLAALELFLGPIRERRAELERTPDVVEEILDRGNRIMREVARTTLEEVRNAMGLNYFR